MKKVLKALLRLVIKVGIISAIVFAILTYVLGIYRATGNNMFPSIKDGDLCIMYKLEDYHMSDVVLYEHEGSMKIGRIVGIGGQEVNLPETGGYLINGYQPTEEITYQTYRGKITKYPMTVDEGSFFIMNDFRSDTKDSRDYGVIDEGSIKGKLIFIVRRRNF